MDILLQNHSSYPRIDDLPAGRERHAVSAAALTALERAEIEEILDAQAQAGLDIITDGQVHWADPISHVMAALDGVRIDGSFPYFDTPVGFRRPVITAAIHRRTAIVRDDFTRAAALSRACVKPILPGPYTVARLCEMESGPYRDVAELAHAVSAVLAAEVRDLVAAGAQIIQIEEPAILSRPTDIRLLRRLLEPLWDARGDAQLVLATYFGDAAPLYAELNSLPADILALDVSSSPGLVDLIATTGASKTLALGLIDGRNPELEDPSHIARQVESVLLRYTLDAIHLMPSCGLAYLPQRIARAKLELLSRVRQLVHVSDGDSASLHARRAEGPLR